MSADTEADAILAAARRQAEQITGNARARAESLERDAGERHREAMGSLVQSREELERRVNDMRAFEREYRSRIRAYLQGLLRDLDESDREAGITEPVTVSRDDLQSFFAALGGGQFMRADCEAGVAEQRLRAAGGAS